jgi:hypothetical protein
MNFTLGLRAAAVLAFVTASAMVIVMPECFGAAESVPLHAVAVQPQA